jgi:DNA-binding LacI/PurR family transcriptional regulator
MDAPEETSRVRRPRPSVMSDVARLAGVSHQTVSRVINGSPHVRPDTRQKVQAAMRELDYRPNRMARALVTGRSHTLGVVSFDTTLYGPASTLLGIERAAHEAGYFIIVASLKALNRSSVADAVDRLRWHGVDGLLVISAVQDAADALLTPPDDIPLVAVEAGPDEAVPVVEVDQHAGAALATRHLLELGHRNVWHLAGPSEFLEARQRLAGWRDTLERTGVEPPVHLTGDWSARAGYELGTELAASTGLTALFVANDHMALGVLRAMQESGRRVPEDVSVVGFDDIPESPYLMPPLTTVRQDFDERGARALQLLLRMIDKGGATPPHPRLPPRLVIRGSTSRALTSR